MPWWSWVLVWIALVVGAGIFLFSIGRSLWRQTKELLKEVGTASERFGAIEAQLDKLDANAARTTVFDDPVQVRIDQAKAARASRPARGRVR